MIYQQKHCYFIEKALNDFIFYFQSPCFILNLNNKTRIIKNL
jgi:hypothetical protein